MQHGQQNVKLFNVVQNQLNSHVTASKLILYPQTFEELKTIS